MAAVELQRQADGTAFAALRSSADENRFIDIAIDEHHDVVVMWRSPGSERIFFRGCQDLNRLLRVAKLSKALSSTTSTALFIYSALSLRAAASTAQHAVSSNETGLSGHHQQRTAPFLEMSPKSIVAYYFPSTGTTLGPCPSEYIATDSLRIQLQSE
jgi:hypothetical protein